MEKQNFQHRPFRNHLILGGLIIVIGLILLGINFGSIPQNLRPVLISWQMLVILLGIAALFYAKYWNGIILLLIGGFFLIPRLYEVSPSQFSWAGEHFVSVYYPVLLIAGGVLLIIYRLLPEKYKSIRRRNHRQFWQRHYHHSAYNHSRNEYAGYETNYSTNREKRNYVLNKSVVFAGCDEIYLEEVFHGGEIDTVFGGFNLDLRRTTLPEGETFLDINVVFGGVEIYVPDTWLIELHTDAVAGGFTDSRLIESEKIDMSRKLIIGGSFVFGGGEIKC